MIIVCVIIIICKIITRIIITITMIDQFWLPY